MRKPFNILCFKLVVMILTCLCVLSCLAYASATSVTQVLTDNSRLYLAIKLEGHGITIKDNSISMGIGDTLTVECKFKDYSDNYVVWWNEAPYSDVSYTLFQNSLEIPNDHWTHMGEGYNIPSYSSDPYLKLIDGPSRTFLANKEGFCAFNIWANSRSDVFDFLYEQQTFKVKIHNQKTVESPFVSVDAGNENGLLAYATGGQGMNINVTSNTDWQLKVTEGTDWITLSRSTGSGSGSFYTTISPNSGSERTGWIELTAPGCETIRIRVTQEGIPLTSAPEWQSESKEIDSLEDAVQLFYQVEDSAQYVLLTYEGYDASEQLVEQYTLGTYKVKKQAMAAVSSHKYEIDSLESFDKPISKLYLTICDENSNLLSQRSKPFVIYRTDLIDGTAVADGSLLAPEWASESKTVNSEEDSVGLYYQVDETAQYVKLEYEGYDENDQLIETADDPLGVYPVEKHIMAMVSSHKYKIGNSFSQFSVPASKLYLTVCDAYGNALSPRSEAMVVYRQDLIEAATKPEIFSVVLSCNGADAIVGERFTLTVHTNSKTTKLVAKNNTGTGFKEPDAWSAKQNSDGTITWTRSYTAEDEAKGRYWTVTPYNAAGTKAAAVSSNKIDIDGLEWYTAYYKFDNKGKKVPAANGIIEVDASQVQNIQIYAGDLHPSDNNGQNPYYYKIEDTSVLSVANEHSFNMKVGKEGLTSVEVWNSKTNKAVSSVKVYVASGKTNALIAEQSLQNEQESLNESSDRTFAVVATNGIESYAIQNGMTVDFSSEKLITEISFLLLENIDGNWQSINPFSYETEKNSFIWNVTKVKGDAVEYGFSSDGVFTSKCFIDQSYNVNLQHNSSPILSFKLNIATSDKLKASQYCLVGETGENYIVASSAWFANDDTLPKIQVKNRLNDSLQKVDSKTHEISIGSDSTGSVWSEKLKEGKIEHKTAGIVNLMLTVNGIAQNDNFVVYCSNKDYVSLDRYSKSKEGRQIRFDVQPDGNDRYGVKLYITDVPDFVKDSEAYVIGYTLAYAYPGSTEWTYHTSADIGSWKEASYRDIVFSDVPYNQYASVMVYIRSRLDNTYLYSDSAKAAGSFSHTYYCELIKENQRETLFSAVGINDKLTDAQIEEKVHNMSWQTLVGLKAVEYAGFIAEYVVDTAENLVSISQDDETLFWKAVNATGVMYDYLDSLTPKMISGAIGYALEVDGEKIEFAVDEAGFWLGLAKNPEILDVALHYLDESVNVLEGESSILSNGNASQVNIFNELNLSSYDLWIDTAKDILFLIDSNNPSNIIQLSVDLTAGASYLSDKRFFENADVPTEVAQALALYGADEIKDNFSSLKRINRKAESFFFLDFLDPDHNQTITDALQEVMNNPSYSISIVKPQNTADKLSFDEWVAGY